MATVGISIERTVVRGVVLTRDSREILLRATQRRLPGDTTAAVVTAMLDGFAAELGASDRLDDVAIVYRSVLERRAILTDLAAGKWAAASLVSDRTALAELIRAEPGFGEFGTVLMLEVLDGHTSFVCLGPDRNTVAAADSWAFGMNDTDAAAQILPILNTVTPAPDAVILCGADDPAITPALRRGLPTTVALVPYHADAAARGAALIAADQLRSLAPAPPADTGRTRRLLAAAVAVTVLGTSAVGVAALLDSRSGDEAAAPQANTVVATSAGASTPGPGPTASATATPGDGASAPTPPEPASTEPSTPNLDPPLPAESINPPPPSTTAQPPGALWSTTPPPPRSPAEPEPAEPTEAPPAEPPPSPPRTTVGAPDGNWLFPGESPPPPANADPELIRAWWANHWLLKERWLRGG
ncbi:hypothetical protein [Nocardia sp. NPDC048505]|uniref:hypothetical protein n=1 Tax=unclassified Nocardia TaxID=2637762 RepID=UPI0034067E3F